MKKTVWVELGLQTIHDDTRVFTRSGFTYETFQKSLFALHALSIKVIVHLILGLPHETREMMSASVQAIANLPVWGIKLQLLHVLSGTDLAAYYEKTHFPVFSMNEYCEMIIDCLELLPPEMVIHRITGGSLDRTSVDRRKTNCFKSDSPPLKRTEYLPGTLSN